MSIETQIEQIVYEHIGQFPIMDYVGSEKDRLREEDRLKETLKKFLPIIVAEAKRETADLAYLAQVVMRLLEIDRESVVAHLIDNDDNAGERLRKSIESILGEDGLIKANIKIDKLYGLEKEEQK